MSTPAIAATPPAPGRFHLGRYALWFILCAGTGVAQVWFSLKLQNANLSPLVVFSIVLGSLAALIWFLLARAIGNGHRRAILLGGVVLSLELAFLQHLFAYQEYRWNIEATLQQNAQAALMRAANPEIGTPASFSKYMWAESQKQGRLFMWCMDTALIVLSAIAVLWLTTRRPYCNQCQRWYHVARGGALTSPAALAACFRAAGQEVIAEMVSPKQYSVFSCRGGCSPDLLDFSWQTTSGERKSEKAWLTAEQRTALETNLQAAWTQDTQPVTNPADEQ